MSYISVIAGLFVTGLNNQLVKMKKIKLDSQFGTDVTSHDPLRVNISVGYVIYISTVCIIVICKSYVKSCESYVKSSYHFLSYVCIYKVLILSQVYCLLLGIYFITGIRYM